MRKIKNTELCRDHRCYLFTLSFTMFTHMFSKICSHTDLQFHRSTVVLKCSYTAYHPCPTSALQALLYNWWYAQVYYSHTIRHWFTITKILGNSTACRKSHIANYMYICSHKVYVMAIVVFAMRPQ